MAALRILEEVHFQSEPDMLRHKENRQFLERRSAELAPTVDRETNCPNLLAENKKLREALAEAKLQLEYLDEKLPKRGTTQMVLSRIENALNPNAGF